MFSALQFIVPAVLMALAAVLCPSLPKGRNKLSLPKSEAIINQNMRDHRVARIFLQRWRNLATIDTARESLHKHEKMQQIRHRNQKHLIMTKE